MRMLREPGQPDNLVQVRDRVYDRGENGLLGDGDYIRTQTFDDTTTPGVFEDLVREAVLDQNGVHLPMTGELILYDDLPPQARADCNRKIEATKALWPEVRAKYARDQKARESGYQRGRDANLGGRVGRALFPGRR